MNEAIAIEYTSAVLRYAPVNEWSCIEDYVHKRKHVDPIIRLLLADYEISILGDTNRATATIEQCIGDIKQGTIAMLYYEAMKYWVIEQNLPAAYQVFTKIVQQEPGDLFACKRGQLMALLGGFNAKILTITEFVDVDSITTALTPYFYGMRAFGLEQSNAYTLAEQVSLEGMKVCKKLNVFEGWLQHSYAHALFFQGEDRIDDGIKFLESNSKDWTLDQMMPFLYTHLWWHLSILYVLKGDNQKGIDLFDHKLWFHEEIHRDVQVQINALELLWRLEQSDKIELKSRWKSIYDEFKPKLGYFRDPLHHTLFVGAICISSDNPKLDFEQHCSAKEVNETMKKLLNCIFHIFCRDEYAQKAKQDLENMKSEWNIVGGSTEQRLVLFESVLAL